MGSCSCESGGRALLRDGAWDAGQAQAAQLNCRSSFSIPQSLAGLIFRVTGLRSYSCPGKQNHVREQMGEATCLSLVLLQKLVQLLESCDLHWPAGTAGQTAHQGPMPLPHIRKAASALLPSIASIYLPTYYPVKTLL